MPSIEALRATAEAALQAGDHLRAVAAYESLLRAGAARPDDWFNLGYARQRIGRHGEALDAYDGALAAGATGVQEIHLQRATLLADHLARPQAARQALRAAIAAAPGWVPAWVNLGNLEERMGSREAAVHAYESALRCQPEHALALARLSQLLPVAGPDDASIHRLRLAIGRAGDDLEGRADLGFALASALDRAGAWDEAFEALQAAHQASGELARRRGRAYQAEAVEQWFARQREAFPLPVAAPAGGEADEAAPVFICGMFRSGSTLLEKMLASHPEVTAAGELELLPRIAARLSPGRVAWPPPPADLAGWRQAYLDELRRRHGSWRLLTDKRPDNVVHLGLVKALFPKARILHTRRAPLDNCLAVHFLHLDMPYAQSLADTAHWYGQYRGLMAHWKRHFGDDILDVDYERLVQQPREVLTEVLAFCGLPWRDECLDFHTAPGVVATPSAWQVRQPLYTRSIGRWRRYARQLEPVRRYLAGRGLDPEQPGG